MMVINDIHLKHDNIDEITRLIEESISVARKNKVNDIVLAGDLFDSRVSQRQNVLIAMLNLFSILISGGFKVHVIPGNHDKTDYGSNESFLDIYQGINGLTLYREHSVELIGGKEVHFVPFFKDSVLHPILKGIKTESNESILVSHFAISGSINNDGSKVDSSLKIDDLKNFGLVLLGHYHNTQKVSNNRPKVVHCPSLRQNNFGEDQNKGYTIIYDDLTYKIINSNFTKFNVFSINLNDNTPQEIYSLTEGINLNEHIRFEITGTKEQVKSFDTSKLVSMGIDCKKIIPGYIFDNDAEAVMVKALTKETIFKKCEDFCDKNSLDFNSMREILEEAYE